MFGLTAATRWTGSTFVGQVQVGAVEALGLVAGGQPQEQHHDRRLRGERDRLGGQIPVVGGGVDAEARCERHLDTRWNQCPEMVDGDVDAGGADLRAAGVVLDVSSTPGAPVSPGA